MKFELQFRNWLQNSSHIRDGRCWGKKNSVTKRKSADNYHLRGEDISLGVVLKLTPADIINRKLIFDDTKSGKEQELIFIIIDRLIICENLRNLRI